MALCQSFHRTPKFSQWVEGVRGGWHAFEDRISGRDGCKLELWWWWELLGFEDGMGFLFLLWVVLPLNVATE